MGNLTIATVFLVFANVLMFLIQASMTALNPGGTMCYSTDGSVIGESMSGVGNMSVASDSALDDLPGSAGTVTTDDTSFFTDIFNNILSWFKSAPGIKYVYGVVSAPFNIMTCMGLPSELVGALGVFWYLTTLLVLVAFLWGRD